MMSAETRRKIGDKTRRHGHAGSPTYKIWVGIKTRCYNPNDPTYKFYGDRGITMCAEWRGSFANFLADMGERPLGKSIERVDNNKNYEPGNCRWATRSEQARNKRNNHLVTFRGETKTVVEWSEITGVPAKSIYGRITRGVIPIELALDPTFKPKKGMGSHASIASVFLKTSC